jgi:exonuclease SbcC
MRLVRIHLLNFRQHADTTIEFRRGLTGIIGPNGAGKSTILEAIGWAIYGAAAIRGTNDTLRFSRAPGGSRVQVELVFELAGHEYRVVRTLKSAEVFLDGATAPVATSLGGVTQYLERRLGMSREEFFNTYFTGQKELQFLAQMGAAQRGLFLSQVLGYERLRVAQERVRQRRNELRHEAEGLRAGLPDPDALRAEREAAERRRKEAIAATRAAEKAAREAAERALALAPRWREAQAAREQDRELAHAIGIARAELEAAEREAARARAELDAATAAAAELAALREQLAALPTVVQECEQLAEQARLTERRRALVDSERALVGELREGERRLAAIEQAPRLAEQYGQELEEARRELLALEQAVSEQLSEWVQRKEEVRTRLETYRKRGQELKDQMRMLKQAGPDGICPTCERPLGAEFERVFARLRDEWEALVQDGKWLRQRERQLAGKPDELARAETRRAEARAVVEEKTRKLARCQQAVQELDALRADRQQREERLGKLRAELAALPADYDRERHQRAEARLRELRELERRASRLEPAAEARPERERELAAAEARIEVLRARLAETERRRAELGFREDAYRELAAEVERAAAEQREAELRVVELRGTVQAAEQALETALRAQSEYQERRAALASLESEFRHHNELDAALGELRAELNAQLRPELGEIASGFLSELTDGRYTALEIDEKYDVLVLDEGEEKPVISGGEEDIVNLVLRLAISQMIAERSGHPLSVLILDEVLGSLDLERRDNVIQLLHRLENRYEQVILITHIEAVREGLDQVIRVEFDERTGASIVREETIRPALEELAS